MRDMVFYVLVGSNLIAIYLQKSLGWPGLFYFGFWWGVPMGDWDVQMKGLTRECHPMCIGSGVIRLVRN